jgi:hypothetical protein
VITVCAPRTGAVVCVTSNITLSQLRWYGSSAAMQYRMVSAGGVATSAPPDGMMQVEPPTANHGASSGVAEKLSVTELMGGIEKLRVAHELAAGPSSSCAKPTRPHPQIASIQTSCEADNVTTVARWRKMPPPILERTANDSLWTCRRSCSCSFIRLCRRPER